MSDFVSQFIDDMNRTGNAPEKPSQIKANVGWKPYKLTHHKKGKVKGSYVLDVKAGSDGE